MIVVLTGASAGVGRATALEFARQGRNVAILARNGARLEAAAAELRCYGVSALPIVADVAEAEAVEAAADRVEKELGPIDVWVNNAMATIFAPIHRITSEEFRRGTAVTYLGQVHGTMAALARMRHRDRGTIVNVGSALAYRADPTAIGLLWCQICGAGVHRRGADRTDA
jgi:NAD(P)-dependent dehydrogenase (short-subunit alcohol dehydrogenase family)